MKKVLIISPYFPPVNAADMHRIRISLPYYKQFGWEAEVVIVDPVYSDLAEDELLYQSIPQDITIHKVRALSKKWTKYVGLGSIALRSLWFYRQKVNALLNINKYDLIYFSTTQFPVCVLGAYWKKKYRIPYVMDMQDPWHSEYYRDKPTDQRPSKYWFSYRLNKWLEPLAMKHINGLISVSQNYIDDLKNRYPEIKHIPSAVITFGASEKDLEISKANLTDVKAFNKTKHSKIQITYIGRGGADLIEAINLVFQAMLIGLQENRKLFEQFRFNFIGTSYASPGQGVQSIQPLADKMGLNSYVSELTNRIGFYETLKTLQEADILFIPGSDDSKYTPSKIYSYLMVKKPILAVFHNKSSAVSVFKACSTDIKIFTFPGKNELLISDIYKQLNEWASGSISPPTINNANFEKYSSSALTSKQTDLFNIVLNNHYTISKN